MSKPRVLVVDDSEMTRALIRRLLDRHGFATLGAADGAEGAVTALREQPDVVVTDLEMPVMDGYQLARLLKSDETSREIPLLILTSRQEASSRFWGLETGADEFLIKDDLEAGLVPAVRELLAARPERQERPAGAPQGPLDVLARVSRHLDSRLMEAVLVNRVLERGMQADGVEEAADAVLRTVAELIDTNLLVLVSAEPERNQLVVRSGGPLSEARRDEVAARLLAHLELPPEAPQQVLCLQGAGEAVARLDLERLVLVPLPLRGARGLLALVPRRRLDEGSRDRLLLEGLAPHLGLVLDNARLAQRLRELSMIDGLTRLLNRRSIHQRLSEEIERSRRSGSPLAVVLCDLDHFKKINDTHGHLAGDAVLVAVAETFRRHLRLPDAVGRFGGEEFLVVLPDDSLEDAVGVAHRLLEDLRELAVAVAPGVRLPVSASFGVAALLEVEDPSPHTLVALADRRLYEAKAGGRGRVAP